MKKFIQSYHAFLPRGMVKWILYLMYPGAVLLLLFVGSYLVPEGSFGEVFTVGLMVGLPVLMIAIECLIDMFVFGGLGSKESNQRMEFIKTSVRGKKLVHRALIYDGVRRFLYIAAMGLCLYLTNRREWGSALGSMLVWICLCLAAVTGFFISLALWVIRFIDNRTVQVAAFYLAINIPLFSLVYSIGKFDMDLPVIFGISCVGYVITAIGQILVLKKKVKEGYYDGKA